MHRYRLLAVLTGFALVATGCNGDVPDDDVDDAAPDDEAPDDEAPDDVDSDGLVFWSTENQPDRVAATQGLLDGFTDQSGTEVELVPVAEDDLPSLMISAAASGDLPDLVAHPLDYAAGWMQEGLLDPDAANEVIEDLGVDTFSEGALDLVTIEDQPVTIPSDGWGQFLIYRADLFEEVGLETPDTYEAIRAAAEELHDPDNDIYGITAATDPADVFTQQTFEHFALANDCSMVDADGEITLDQPECVEALAFYEELMNDYSPGGLQDVETTRATYFAGQAAMIVWSPFILDGLAGLRDDVMPNCPECGDNPAYLAENSGFVTALSGGDAEPSQYGQVTYLGITTDADTAAAQEFAQYWFDDGYMDWLGIAAQGKTPMRHGTEEEPQRFLDEWRDLEIGVDTQAPLSDFYGEDFVDALLSGTEQFDRWGFGEGEAELVSAMYEDLIVPEVLNDVLTADLPAEEAAQRLQDSAESLR